MNTLIDTARSVAVADGTVTVLLDSGRDISFPVSGNPRLATATVSQLRRVRLSPLGIHWPDLDEDMSIRELLEGDFGQHRRAPDQLQPA